MKMNVKANRKSVLGVVILTAALFGGWVKASLETGEYLGEIHYVVADVNGEGRFDTTDEAARYLLIGFDSAPVVLELSDETAPKLVIGYTPIETAADQGVYMECAVAGTFAAEGIMNMVEVTKISQR